MAKRNFRSTLKKYRRRITYSHSFISIIAFIGYSLIWLLSKTLKTKIITNPQFRKIDYSKSLYAFWHGRQFLLVPHFGSFGITLMSDVSWAGEIQTRILKQFGYNIVRGSSSRKGMRALLSLKKSLDEGYSSALAVDGPHGPAFKVKPGITYLSKKLKYPIFPVGTSASRAWIIKSTWCYYLLPKPFSRCIIYFGKPLPSSEDFNNFEEIDVEKALNAATAEADKLCGVSFFSEAKKEINARNKMN